MTSVIKYYEGNDSVAVIGTYLPRQCGIATFTTDLVEGISAEAPDIYCWAVAMNDKPEGYPYPEKVRFEINQNKLSDYDVASQFLNISQTDIVCLQHEFGLFGGPAGSHLLKLLGDLRMPVVTTLHTVLKDPEPEYRDVMCKLSDLSDKLVVMSHKAYDFLKDIYAVPEEKVVFIHHGIPDTLFIDSSFYKDKFGVEGKKVLLTFGLLSFLQNPGHLAMSTALFNKALRAVENFHSPRAIAFCLVGTHGYLDKFSGDSDVRRVRKILADRLFDQFKNNAADDWPWLENALNYANGKLPHALLLSGHRMQRNDMIIMGLNSLKWLLAIQTEGTHFVPVGSNGWYEQGGPRARFDQQPVEANAMIEACVEAFNITRDKSWFDNAVMCFNWYLGHNDLNMPLYDPKTGGCRDGLMADGINQNEGAESSLAWLLSLMTLQKLYADEILNQPLSPKTD